jgi:hypothetical protein
VTRTTTLLAAMTAALLLLSACGPSMSQCSELVTYTGAGECWVDFGICSDGGAYQMHCEDDGSGTVDCWCQIDDEQVGETFAPGDFCDDPTTNAYRFAETACGWRG